MNDLIFQKWNSVIVDWVNCLGITKHTQNINSLMNGDFFKAILELLQPDLRTGVKDFLQTYYPNFELPNNEANFTDGELTAAASLLLHYMCLYDRRDSLLNPLCNKLHSNVQTHIKYFLENFTSSTKFEEFDEVIRKAIECELPHDSSMQKNVVEWNSSGESPHVYNSPLFEYFKTPIAKSAKMQEKDRELRRLQQELELERFEKEDLNVEIKEHKGRIKKIAQEVHDKSITISNLSKRLADLEECIPSNKTQEVIEIEKLLRTELADSQYYITQLQSEHGEILMHNEEIVKKLARAEEAVCTWQEKSIQFESKYDSIAVKYKSQEQELTNLKINYSELAALLDELRQNKTNTSTYDLDTSTVHSTQDVKSSEEDLAATVVEIQLKECQLEMQQLQANLKNKVEQSDVIEKQLEAALKELEVCRTTYHGVEELKNQLEIDLDSYILTNQQFDTEIHKLTDECTHLEKTNVDLHESLQTSIEASQTLEDELQETKIHFNELNNNHRQLQSSNEQLHEQLNTLKQTEQSLLLANDEIVKRIEEVTHANCAKDAKVTMLRDQLQVRDDTIANNEILVNSLMKDLDSMHAIRTDLDEKLKNKNTQFKVLEEEGLHLQRKYEEAVEDYNERNFSLEAMQKQLKETDNKLQVNIERLEEMVTGSIESAESDKIERFVQLLDKLASKQMTFENTIENNKKLNQELEQQVIYLRQSNVTHNENLESLQKALEDSQDTVKQFERDIRTKGNEIDELLDNIRSLNETIEELELYKVEFGKTTAELDECKRDKFKLSEELGQVIVESTLRMELNDQLTTKLDEVQEQHKIMRAEIEKYGIKLNELQKDNSDLTNKLVTVEKDFWLKANENEELNKTIGSFEYKVNDFLKEIETLNRHLAEQKLHGEELLKKFEISQQENSQQVVEIDGLQDFIANLKTTNSALHDEIAEYEVESEEHTRQYKELHEKVQQAQQEIAEKSLAHSDLIGKFQLMEMSNHDLHKEVEKLMVALQEQTQQNEELNANFESVEKLSTERLKENKHLSTTLMDLQVQKEELQNELHKSSNNYEIEKSHGDELSLKLTVAEKESTQFRQDIEKCNITVLNLQTTKAELEKDVEHVRNEFVQSKLDNHNLNLTVQNLQTKKSELEAHIDDIRLQLADSKQESDKNTTTIQELMEEIERQLAKLKDKNSELAYVKEQFSNRDLQQMHIMNDLNKKVEELEACKEKLNTDLQVVKDSCLLKQQEINDLNKSKEQLDKHLTKSLKQHEKKHELMDLTIGNLEKKLSDTNLEKQIVQTKLSEETHKVALLNEEKCKVIDERNALEIALAETKKAFYTKEKECVNKDEVVDRANQELFALRLEIEINRSDFADAKNLIKELQHEKSATMENVQALSDKLMKLEEKYTMTSDELNVITEMKNSLTQKMEHFKESMQSVFQHFGIRRKNMKQSLDELQKYKNQKDDEVKELISTLTEVREQLEHTKEEGDSVRKELETRIADRQKRLDTLECDIENLKITESGCLQEISMLKEELNYTIDKYTEALQTEKDLKTENESRIQNLTESVHEMLEKYNNLDKEHKLLLDEFAYNQKSCGELQSEKDGLELEIVKLKIEYEEDMKCCKDELESELCTLRKLEANLNAEIVQLKSSLEMTSEDEASLRIELQDAKSHIHVVQTEKSDVLNKLDRLESTYNDLQREFKSMKITNEQYLKETKAALIETQNQLKVEIDAKESIIAHKDNEIGKLRRDVHKLTDRLKKEEEVFKKDIEMRQKQIDDLQVDVHTFTTNIDTLTIEKDAIQARIRKQQHLYDDLLDVTNEKDQTITELEKQLQNLHISHNVLEAGKLKMETLREELQERYTAMEEKHRLDKEGHETTKNLLLAQIDKARAQIRANEDTIKARNAEIDVTNEEFDSVQLILTNMTKKMEATSRHLSVIHEDYEGKLKSERASFEELLAQHTRTTNEMQYMSNLNVALQKELDEMKVERSNAEMLMSEKEQIIGELQQKYDYVASLVVDKDATIASLQAELEVKLEQLANAAGERRHVENEHRRTEQELASVMRQKEELIERHAEFVNAGETNLLRVHDETKQLLARLNDAEHRTESGRAQCDAIEELLKAERDAKRFLEIRVQELEAQLYDANGLKKKLTDNILQFSALLQEREDSLDEEDIDELISNTETRIINVFAKLREMNNINDVAKKDKEYAERTLLDLGKCNKELNDEKAKLLESYEKLHEEKLALAQEKAKESKSLENLQVQYEVLKNKQDSSSHFEQKLVDLQQNNQQRYQNYMEFLQQTQRVFTEIETMVAERNQVEQIVCNLKDNYTTLQIKATHITEDTHKLHYEQKNALEMIISDIYKQFRRYSKMIYNLNLKCHQIVDRTVTAIINDKSIDWNYLYKELSSHEIIEKVEDLKDNASNALEQLHTFLVAIESISVKEEKPKVLKENQQSVMKPKEDDWKKKYLNVKQKLTLVENAKNNFEKKIRQLRDENKKLATSTCLPTDATIKVEFNPDIKTNVNNIVQDEYIQLKQQYESQQLEWEEKYYQLQRQCEFNQDSKASMASVMELVEVKNELEALKSSYRDLKVNSSKLELDYSAMQQLVADRNEQLIALTATKESYSQIMEENSKLQSQIDTIKYKRTRDREEYVKQLKKNDAEVHQKMQTIKTEYDLKLEKLKTKIVSKYKEQVEQSESQKIERLMTMKEENEHYKSTISKLKGELAQAHAKVEILDSEKHYVLQQLRVQKDEFDFKEPLVLSRRASSQSLQSETVRNSILDERRFSTLPRNAQGMDVIEEVHYRRRTSIAPPPPTELEMEDEGDMFNNKYLHDLKEGRCSLASGNGRESTSSRLSEFAYRNSMCPPHLKSSYPAETQFLDHRQFKEDDLKTGNIEFDDSMKTHLLPHDKPKKKDIGTTSYKRPGPPTPSKHGGRSSLQGNERNNREVLRELTEQKRTTPNPLRSLFSRSKDTTAENTVSPKKRTSFFRR